MKMILSTNRENFITWLAYKIEKKHKSGIALKDSPANGFQYLHLTAFISTLPSWFASRMPVCHTLVFVSPAKHSDT